MAIKRHRLLHTLVFSSVLAAGGCGAAAPAPLEPAAAAATDGGAEGSVYAAYEDTSAAPDPDPVAADPVSAERRALRYCENGWPTTKGASLRCETSADADGDAESVCCDRMFTDDADFGTDPAQCCVVGS